MFTSHLRLAPTFKMSGAITLLPPTPHPLCHRGMYGAILLLPFTPQLTRRGSGKRRRTSATIAVIWPNFGTKHLSNTSLLLHRTAVWKKCCHHYVQMKPSHGDANHYHILLGVVSQLLRQGH